jgi:hypothetical protein
MTYQLISVVEYPLESDDLRCPSIAERGTPVLDADEEVLWSGTTIARTNYWTGKIWKEAWKAPEPASVFLTDRRIVYTVRKFDRGSTYVGGLVIDAAIMTAVSKARAAGRRRGRIAAGQINHLWALDVTLFGEKGMVKRTQPLAVRCQVDDVQHLFILDLSPEHARRLGPMLASAIARHRLAVRSEDLSVEHATSLRAIADKPEFDLVGKFREINFPRTKKVGFD